MANKVFEAFKGKHGIEFWLDGEKKADFTQTLFSRRAKVMMAFKKKVFIKLVNFYLKCHLGWPVHKDESAVSGLIYHSLIMTFLKPGLDEHTFKLFDTGRNIQMEARFAEKDAFLGVFRILDEYAKVVLINQYTLSPETVKGKVVIDGGSNLGEFSIYCARLGAKKIYAFEPVSSTYEILKKQIQLNGLEDVVTVVNKALGDKNEKVTIVFSEVGDSAAKVGAASEGALSEIIEAIRLDDFIGEEKVGLIKLDVEGFEENVLNGARNTISRDKPILALSAYHKPTDLERLPATVLSIRPDYTITLLRKAEADFYCV